MHALALLIQKLIVPTTRGATHVTSIVILLESVLNEKFLAIWTNQ
jgi:hypothetical protein